jgi:hypothetical protein
VDILQLNNIGLQQLYHVEKNPFIPLKQSHGDFYAQHGKNLQSSAACARQLFSMQVQPATVIAGEIL